MAALRARDIRDKLKGKVDLAVIQTLEVLAEQQHQLDKALGDIVLLTNQMADITSSYVSVAENMKKTIDAHRIPDDGEEAGSTHDT
jgi:hypothetical protein